MRCLILDDEAPARLAIRRLLSKHPEMETVGEAADVATALELTRTLQPACVFLDIQLRGESGFDFVAQVQAPALRIVFVTAHDRYAVRGFECNALDYLLKPLHPLRLAATIARLHAPPLAPPAAVSLDGTVLLKIGQTARFVSWREITHIVSEGNYTRVFLSGAAGSVLVLRTLKQWLAQAPAGALLQVHRTALVRRDLVCGVETDPMGRHSVELSGGARIAVSRPLWPRIRAELLQA